MSDFLKNLNSVLPLYECILPFSKKKVFFTPFKVKDAKNISIIIQEENKQLVIQTLVDLLKNCCKDIDPLDLCLADAEYLFMMIRSKSVEENLNLIVNGKSVKVSIYDIKAKNELKSSELKISGNLILKIETPTLKDLLKFSDVTKKEVTLASIKQVTLNKEIYTVDTFVSNEVEELLNNLPLNVMNEIEKINQPQLSLTIKTDTEESEVSGILSFFILR
jgi:hypothetical protein